MPLPNHQTLRVLPYARDSEPEARSYELGARSFVPMSSINRPLAGPMLTFNLKEQLAELRREEPYERSGRAGRTLAKSGRMRLVLIAMAEANVIGTHQAD